MGSNCKLLQTSKTQHKNSSFQTRTKFGPIPNILPIHPSSLPAVANTSEDFVANKSAPAFVANTSCRQYVQWYLSPIRPGPMTSGDNTQDRISCLNAWAAELKGAVLCAGGIKGRGRWGKEERSNYRIMGGGDLDFFSCFNDDSSPLFPLLIYYESVAIQNPSPSAHLW